MTKFMNGIVEILTLAAAISASGSALAGDVMEQHKIKPLAALTFHAGSKHGVGYFVDDARKCKLVLTMSDSTSETSDFTVTRYETSIPAGSASKYGTSPGRALEFTCLPNAEAMLVREIQRVVNKGAE